MTYKGDSPCNAIEKSYEMNQFYDSTKIVRSDIASNRSSIEASEILDFGDDLSFVIKPSQENAPNSDMSQQNINVNYRGNKNEREKGKYSELPEVLNKNLIRSIRRYLSELHLPSA